MRVRGEGGGEKEVMIERRGRGESESAKERSDEGSERR